MKAGIYTRVSTSMQVDKESLRFQEERARHYCKSQDYSVYKVYVEKGVSAKDTNRPQLAEMMNDIRQGRIKIVIVTKLDRITRSLRDLIGLIEFFQDHDVKLISITQNIDTTGAMGRFILKASIYRGRIDQRQDPGQFVSAPCGKVRCQRSGI